MYLTGWFSNNVVFMIFLRSSACCIFNLSSVLIPELSLTLALLSAPVCSNHEWQGTFQFVFGDVMSFQVRGILHHNVTDLLLWFWNKLYQGSKLRPMQSHSWIFFLCDWNIWRSHKFATCFHLRSDNNYDDGNKLIIVIAVKLYI